MEWHIFSDVDVIIFILIVTDISAKFNLIVIVVFLPHCM